MSVVTVIHIICRHTQLILYSFRSVRGGQLPALLCMLMVCRQTTECTIYSPCNTQKYMHAHTHRPPVLLMWLMHKLQRSDTFGWVSEPEGSLLKKLWEDFYSCSKPTTESFLRSAALCCPLRKLQPNRLSRLICPVFSQPVRQTDSPTKTSTLWPFNL